jgi:GT2 family glycosyltransferase
MKETPVISVLTILRGREAHLANVLRGLSRQTAAPDEMVIAVMGDAPVRVEVETPFPVRQVLVPGEPLPLAEARNAAAREARGDVLVFVDVDCIPAPELVGDYVRGLEGWPGLLMGEVMYLPAGAAAGGWTYGGFDAVAERHSDRQGPPPSGVRPCEDYRCFWSLNFAMTAATWAASGGFDEAYVGYGGEDTDFGRTLDAAGIPIGWMKGGRVYHQHHPHHMPPVHHIPSILRNTEVFRAKWGEYTMGHWLHAFALMGLVERTPDGWRRLREPGPEDLALTEQQSHMPYANSARVIRMLRARVEVGAADDPFHGGTGRQPSVPREPVGPPHSGADVWRS